MADDRRKTEPQGTPLPPNPDAPPPPGTASSPTEEVDVRSLPTPQVRVAALPVLATLTVLAGPAELRHERFEIRGRKTTIGRSPDCSINLLDPGISRLHAIIHYDGREFSIEHRSGTNSTYVNGIPVEGVQSIRPGDEIQLADRVRMRLDDRSQEGVAAPSESPASGDSLASVMEARIELEDRIERQFVRIGTFLDVDVVDSFGLKSAGASPDRVVVSFERFRGFIAREVVNHEGQVLNSNGDEVMAFFPSADAAVASARAIIADLTEFNRTENLLVRSFLVRQGAHLGRSAVDLRAGVAYSPVLDTAGHLQKDAPDGGLLVSADVYDALTNREGFSKAGVVGKTGVDAYVLRPPES